MNLPVLTPNTARAARAQARCHEHLERQQRRRLRRDLVVIRIERTLVASLAVIYLAAVTVNVLSVFAAF